MAFDIYGNNLRRGHCEVHPNVHEEYPCALCCAEKQNYDAQQHAQSAYEEGYQQGLIDGYNKAIEEKKTCTF